MMTPFKTTTQQGSTAPQPHMLFQYPSFCHVCQNPISHQSPLSSYERRGTKYRHLECTGGTLGTPTSTFGFGSSPTSSLSPSSHHNAGGSTGNSLRDMYNALNGRPPRGGSTFSAAPHTPHPPQPVHTPPNNSMLHANMNPAHAANGRPPSYIECRNKELDLYTMLQLPNLNIDYLFQTGLNAENISNMRRQGGPRVIQEFARSGLTCQKLVEECKKDRLRDQQAQAKAGIMSRFTRLMSYGGKAESPEARTLGWDPRAVTFTQEDWRVLGARGPNDLGIPASVWHEIPQQ